MIVVKLGPEGALVFERQTGNYLHVPAYPARVSTRPEPETRFVGDLWPRLCRGIQLLRPPPERWSQRPLSFRRPDGSRCYGSRGWTPRSGSRTIAVRC